MLLAACASMPGIAFAQSMMEAVPRSSGGSSNWSAPSLVLPEANAPAPPSAPSKMNNELTLPSVINQQASVPPSPPRSDSTRVIPVIPPNQEVLVLPQASRDFLGQWGGKLSLVTRYGESFDPPEHNIVSLVFGERNGQVVMATIVYGTSQSQVLKSDAQAQSPTEVTLVISGLDLSSQPPERHVEKLTMALADNNQVKCTKRVDFYVSGFPHPAAEAVYEGMLRPLTLREQEALNEDLFRHGDVPRARIDQGNPPPQPLE